MATSGSKNFSVTRNDIINAALRKLGEFDVAEAPGGDETTHAAFALNSIIKEFAGFGADLWLRTEITLFVQKGTESYSIGLTGDHATESYVETALSSAAGASATSMAVDSITGVTASDNIGVKLDDGSIHWTTVNGTPTGSTIVLTAGLASAAADNNKVYTYTTKAYRPHSIIYASRRDTNGYDTPVTLIGDEDYRWLAQKDQVGVANQAFYRQTLTNGTLFVCPTGGGNSDKIILTAQYYPDDFDSSSDNPEFPVEWVNTLVFNLASELAPEYGLPWREQRDLSQRAAAKLRAALDFDVENASVEFVRDGR